MTILLVTRSFVTGEAMSESEKSLYNSKENVLKELLLNYGIDSTELQRRQLLKHIELLIEINKNLNLTRITSVDDALVLHVLDSLLPLKVCNEFLSCTHNYIDIGTGGGFPGLPLAIMSDNKTLLVDSIGKKINAVQSMIDEIGLNERVRAEKLRAEEIPNAYKQKFDFVTFRAVAKTNILLEYAEPFLASQGTLIVMKANVDEIELQDASQAAKIFGYENVSRETFELPNNLGHREILLYKKVTKSNIKLPRKTGMAKSNPFVARRG